MNIEIHQNFALSLTPKDPVATPPEKRAADEAPSDEPPTKRIERTKILPPEIAYAAKILVEHYDFDQFQQADLQSVAEATQFVPTVEEVEWLAEEVRFREGSTHKLQVWMFPNMEYYPWYLRSEGSDHRMFLGAFRRCDGMVWELWAGSTLTTKGSTKIHLYHHGPMPDDGDKGENKLAPAHREFISWLPSFVMCFRIEDMMPRHLTTELSFKKAASLQDSYIKGMMKVLARFPGLIPEAAYIASIHSSIFWILRLVPDWRSSFVLRFSSANASSSLARSER